MINICAYLINKRGPTQVRLGAPGFWNDWDSTFSMAFVLRVLILLLSWAVVVKVHLGTPVCYTWDGVTWSGLILIESFVAGALASAAHFLRKLGRRYYRETCKSHLQTIWCRIRPSVSCRVGIVGKVVDTSWQLLPMVYHAPKERILLELAWSWNTFLSHHGLGELLLINLRVPRQRWLAGQWRCRSKHLLLYSTHWGGLEGHGRVIYFINTPAFGTWRLRFLEWIIIHQLLLRRIVLVRGPSRLCWMAGKVIIELRICGLRSLDHLLSIIITVFTAAILSPPALVSDISMVQYLLSQFCWLLLLIMLLMGIREKSWVALLG